MKQIVLILIGILLFSCKGNQDSQVSNQTAVAVTPLLNYSLIKTYPHDTTSFTEGFLIHDGSLFESTGASEELPQTRSLFGIVDTLTGKIKTKAELDKQKYFGEGIVFLNGKVYQLTYKNRIGFVYDEKTFKKIREFPIVSKEGWGFTTDGKYLIMSDGTHILSYLDPETLAVVKTIQVSENGYALENINELEFIKGYIFANIWTTYTIVKIDPANGKVIGKLDLTPLANDSKTINDRSLEMNGIAYDSIKNSLLITGKLWPKIYDIKID